MLLVTLVVAPFLLIRIVGIRIVIATMSCEPLSVQPVWGNKHFIIIAAAPVWLLLLLIVLMLYTVWLRVILLMLVIVTLILVILIVGIGRLGLMAVAIIVMTALRMSGHNYR